MKKQLKLSPVSLTMILFLVVGVTQAKDDTIVVIGQQEESAVGPDFNYRGAISRTATKTDTPISKTPRAISIVTREQMDDRAPISISDALQYTPSIQANFYGEDNRQDWFVIRGFKQANNGQYKDGTRLYSSGFYSWQIDPYALERVEILRGPASTLYGQTPPGGVINLISKRPQFDGGSGSVSLGAGSYDRKQLNLDVNTEINNKLAFRLVGLARENGTRIDNVDAARLMIAPSLTWKITDATELTFLTSYQQDNSKPYVQFYPMGGTLAPNPNGKISDSTAVGNIDWETFKRNQLSIGYEFQHNFSDNLYFAQSTRFSQLDINLRQMYSVGYIADNKQLGPLLDPAGSRQTILRAASEKEGGSNAANLDNRLVFKFDVAKTKHTFLAGVDYQSIHVNNKDFATDALIGDGNQMLPTPFGYNVANPAFNIFNPTYSKNIILLNPTTLREMTEADRQTTKTKNKQLGFYLQDQVIIADQFALLAGVRYDDARNETHNITTSTKTQIDNKAWTTNLGSAFISDTGFTPYVNYAQSFLPIIKWDKSGNPAKPERSESVEIGIKFQPSRTDAYFNLAAYQVSKENLTRTNAVGELTQIGEVRNRGLEFEAVANVTNSLTLIGNIGMIDSVIRKDTNASYVGNTPSQIADKIASLWTHYRFLDGILDGLRIGGGARYVSGTYADNTKTDKVPAYILFDATAGYRIGNYKFQVAAKNLFDKKYITTCDYYCFYGDRRNVIASVAYDW